MYLADYFKQRVTDFAPLGRGFWLGLSTYKHPAPTELTLNETSFTLIGSTITERHHPTATSQLLSELLQHDSPVSVDYQKQDDTSYTQNPLSLFVDRSRSLVRRLRRW